MSSRKTLGAVMVVGAALIACAVGPGVLSAVDFPKDANSEKNKYLLTPTQDESSTEKRIALFLKKECGMRLATRFLDDEMSDLLVHFRLGKTGAPSLKLNIDTQPSARHKVTNKVTQRVVHVIACFVLPSPAKTDEARKKLFELNNRWMNKLWSPSRIIIDSDGDLRLSTAINITEHAPLHAGAVLDACRRLVDSWHGYYQELRKTVPLTKEKDEDA